MQGFSSTFITMKSLTTYTLFLYASTGNKFFLHSTGLTLEEVECLTIFSIVRADKLSALFEIVADALEKSSSHSVASTSKESSLYSESRNYKSKVRRALNYEALTLPCISFPSRYKRSSQNTDVPIPLYMKVSSNSVLILSCMNNNFLPLCFPYYG